LSNISVALDIPDITSSVKNFTDINTKMISDGLKLETVSEAILEARQTYEKSKVYLDGSLTFLPFIENPWTAAIFGIIVIIVLALLILAFTALVAKILKMDKILKSTVTTVALMDTLLPHAEGTFITKPVSPTPTTIIPENTAYTYDIGGISCILSIFIAIILAHIFIKCATTMYNMCKDMLTTRFYGTKYYNTGSCICLFMTNATDSILLRTLNIPIPSDLIVTSIPPNIASSSFIVNKSAKLRVKWNGVLTICTKTLNYRYSMPENIIVPRGLTRKFKKLMSQQHSLKIVVAIEEPLRFLNPIEKTPIFNPERGNYSVLYSNPVFNPTAPPPYNTEPDRIEFVASESKPLLNKQNDDSLIRMTPKKTESLSGPTPIAKIRIKPNYKSQSQR